MGPGGGGRARGGERPRGTAACGGKGVEGRTRGSGERAMGAARCGQQRNPASGQPPPAPPPPWLRTTPGVCEATAAPRHTGAVLLRCAAAKGVANAVRCSPAGGSGARVLGDGEGEGPQVRHAGREVRAATPTHPLGGAARLWAGPIESRTRCRWALPGRASDVAGAPGPHAGHGHVLLHRTSRAGESRWMWAGPMEPRRRQNQRSGAQGCA